MASHQLFKLNRCSYIHAVGCDKTSDFNLPGYNHGRILTKTLTRIQEKQRNCAPDQLCIYNLNSMNNCSDDSERIWCHVFRSRSYCMLSKKLPESVSGGYARISQIRITMNVLGEIFTVLKWEKHKNTYKAVSTHRIQWTTCYNNDCYSHYAWFWSQSIVEISYGYVFWAQGIHQCVNGNIPSLTDDLEIQGETFLFCMAFLISNWKLDTCSLLDLGVDFNIFEIKNITDVGTNKVIWRLILTLTIMCRMKKNTWDRILMFQYGYIWTKTLTSEQKH